MTMAGPVNQERLEDQEPLAAWEAPESRDPSEIQVCLVALDSPAPVDPPD